MDFSPLHKRQNSQHHTKFIKKMQKAVKKLNQKHADRLVFFSLVHDLPDCMSSVDFEANPC